MRRIHRCILMNLSRLSALYYLHGEGKSPHGRFASICRFRVLVPFPLLLRVAQAHALCGGQHAINFNYKNIIILYGAGTGALRSKVSFRCRNLTVAIPMRPLKPQFR